MNRLLKISGLILALVLSFFLAETTHAASMTFTPSSTAFKQSCSSKIDIFIDTQGVSTNAADAVVLFNPAEVQIEDQLSGVAGTQIKPGTIYEIYAGNVVDEAQGKILLTAFSIMGSFNGSGLYGSIYFTSKPGVTSTTFQFQFSPGASTDSNVANTVGSDVLSSVNSASYTFQALPCVADTQTPSVSQVTPANGATGVLLDSTVSLHITDNQSGVDLNTVEIQVHDVVYEPTSPQVSMSGSALDYTFIINPEANFPEATEISIVVNATDTAGNVMSPRVFSFNRPVPPPPPPPPPVCGNNIVETGEECEPPNAFACSAECKSEVLACLEVGSRRLTELAIEASENGTLTVQQNAAISNIEDLQNEFESEPRDSAPEVPPGELRRSAEEQSISTLVNDLSVKIVEKVSKPLEEFAADLGCTKDCVDIVFGYNEDYRYVPWVWGVGLLILVMVVAYVAWRMSRKDRKDRNVRKDRKGKKG